MRLPSRINIIHELALLGAVPHFNAQTRDKRERKGDIETEIRRKVAGFLFCFSPDEAKLLPPNPRRGRGVRGVGASDTDPQP